jgi:hypothetical protein
MSASGPSGKPSFVYRRYLLDRPSQMTVTIHLLCVLAGIGLLYAVAVYALLGSELLSGWTAAELRRVLLGVHTAYFVVGGTVLALVALLLTHRYAGPAFVMQRAVQAMREGDYTSRLELRRHDFHKPLATELALLRDELAAREEGRAKLLGELEQSLDAGDEAATRALLAKLMDRPEVIAVPHAESAAAS